MKTYRITMPDGSIKEVNGDDLRCLSAVIDALQPGETIVNSAEGIAPARIIKGTNDCVIVYWDDGKGVKRKDGKIVDGLVRLKRNSWPS